MPLPTDWEELRFWLLQSIRISGRNPNLNDKYLIGQAVKKAEMLSKVDGKTDDKAIAEFIAGFTVHCPGCHKFKIGTITRDEGVNL